MDCNLPDSSVHGILWVRILEWVAISFSRGSSWPRDRTRVSCVADRFFTNWAIGKPRSFPVDKGPSGQSYDFSSGRVWMWDLDHKVGWVPKNWCFWTVVLRKTLESPLDCKAIEPVNPKGNQSWIFIGRTDAKAETPIFWPPDAKNWLIGKDPHAGKDWSREEKGMTEDEIVGLTRWTWVSVNSRSWWWTGRSGVLQFMGLQRVGHDWVTELNIET